MDSTNIVVHYDHASRTLFLNEDDYNWISIPHNHVWDLVDRIVKEMRESGAHPTFYMSQDEAFKAINGISVEDAMKEGPWPTS